MDNATWKSCFGQWFSLVDPDSLQASITKHGADRYVKKLSTAAVLRLFLYAQLVNASGLRELEIAVRNDSALQRELDIESISIVAQRPRLRPKELSKIGVRLLNVDFFAIDFR